MTRPAESTLCPVCGEKVDSLAITCPHCKTNIRQIMFRVAEHSAEYARIAREAAKIETRGKQVKWGTTLREDLIAELNQYSAKSGRSVVELINDWVEEKLREARK